MQRYDITPYEGEQPYIFISYAHKDAPEVYPIIAELNRRGYRVWYDDGLAPGNEWPEEIARHLNGCSLTIAMLSHRYIASDNCRRELTFALSKQKSFLAVFLEPTELSLGFEMQLSAELCVMKYRYVGEKAFYNKLCSFPALAACRAGIEMVSEETAGTVSDADRYIASARQNTGTTVAAEAPKRWKWIPLAVVGVLAILLGTVFFAVPKLTDSTPAEDVVQSVEESPALPVETEIPVETETPVVTGSERNLSYTQGMDENDHILMSVDGYSGEPYGGTEGAYTYIGTEEERRMSLQGHLIVPETLGGYPVAWIASSAFDGCTGLKQITLPASLREIYMLAFNRCSGLEEIIVLGDTGENLTITGRAFNGCTSLRKVTLPGRVTSISNDAFSGCSALKEIILPKTLRSIGSSAFKGTGFDEISLPDGVTSIGENAFESCEKLRKVVLPSSLTSISSGMFYDCTALESVWIPASVTSIEEEAFFNCSALTDVYYAGSEAQWEKLIAEIDFNYPEGSILRNNMALQQATIHFNS